jgi:hypothetical protein
VGKKVENEAQFDELDAAIAEGNFSQVRVLYRALQRQVGELERLEQAAQAQISHDETLKVILQQRITQLEGALKHVMSLCWPNPVWKDVVDKALYPGHYREWCRDPALCQDKGTCPKDPSCAD